MYSVCKARKSLLFVDFGHRMSLKSLRLVMQQLSIETKKLIAKGGFKITGAAIFILVQMMSLNILNRYVSVVGSSNILQIFIRSRKYSCPLIP